MGSKNDLGLQILGRGGTIAQVAWRSTRDLGLWVGDFVLYLVVLRWSGFKHTLQNNGKRCQRTPKINEHETIAYKTGSFFQCTSHRKKLLTPLIS